MTIIYDEIVVKFGKLLVSTPLYRVKFLGKKVPENTSVNPNIFYWRGKNKKESAQDKLTLSLVIIIYIKVYKQLATLVFQIWRQKQQKNYTANPKRTVTLFRQVLTTNYRIQAFTVRATIDSHANKQHNRDSLLPAGEAQVDT